MGDATGLQVIHRAVRESDAALRGHRRPACVEAATQPRDGCAADVKNWPRRRAHSDQGLHRTRYGGVPTSEPASGEQWLNPSTGSRSREGVCPSGETIGRARLNPSGPTPGRLFGERGSILCSRSRIRGTRILQVSRHETLEKPETASIIARTAERMEGFGGGNRPPETGLLAAMLRPCRSELAPAQTGPGDGSPGPTSATATG